MKKLLLPIALLPFVAMLIAFSPTGLKVQFVQTDWDSAKRKAVNEKKLFFVDFDASYCATCRNMDESTYMDQGLSEYINQNVVAHRVDVQDFDGVMWSQTYEVETLPTMLVFDSKGKLVQKLTGYKSAKDLLKVFNDLRSSETVVPETPTTNIGMQSETPMNTTVVTEQPNVNPTPAPVPTPEPAPAPTPAPAPITTNNTVVLQEEGPTGLGLYEIWARKQDSKGFSVQVGVFNSYENVLNHAANLRDQFPDQRNFLHIDQLNGQTVYKLMVGIFESRREAASFTIVLKQKAFEGMVKDLSMMK